MRPTFALVLIITLIVLGKHSAGAQRPATITSIGFLGPERAIPEFKQGLRQLGYIEGKNIIVEYRIPQGNFEALPELAAELVRRKVAVIVAFTPTQTAAAIKATKTIPIVMVRSGNPANRGYVDSLSVPGGNVTGLSDFAGGLHDKRVELLKETFPSIARVALLNSRTRKQFIAGYKRAAWGLKVQIEPVDVRDPTEIEQAFSKITSMRADALIMVPGETLNIRYARQIAEFCLKQRLPSMHELKEFVTAGGLMSYGVNHRAQWRRAAVFVDKILRGASPSTLPIEPPEFEFVINLATAKKLNRTIPPEILLEANEIIK